jgi:hypothetical protein
MQIWFKMDLTQSHLRTSFQIFSIVFPFLLIELRHRVSVTLYRGDLPGSGTSQDAVQWSTDRSSLGSFDLRRFGSVRPRKVNSRRTVRVTGGWFKPGL